MARPGALKYSLAHFFTLQGDQYDVRDKSGAGDVRNLGKPVELAARYFEEGADEVTFLNITGEGLTLLRAAAGPCCRAAAARR